jgi:hypothetical protein
VDVDPLIAELQSPSLKNSHELKTTAYWSLLNMQAGYERRIEFLSGDPGMGLHPIHTRWRF